MKTTLYWIATTLVALMMLLGGVMDLARAPAVAQTVGALGYPPYLMSVLGVWKLLGAMALVAPRLPRLKEWAYAGIAFELSGAAASHLLSGDTAAKASVPLVILALAIASWALRPASRRLGELFPRQFSRATATAPAPAA